MSESLVEDPVAQAGRHVAQAERHVARQQALVAKLSKNKKHAALVAQAKGILDTMKWTLRVARDHLAIELRKDPSSRPDPNGASVTNTPWLRVGS
jgi:hypothetical protein